MKLKLPILLALVLLVSAFAVAETWNSVPLVDGHCATLVKGNPDAHTRDCMLQCQKAGYGVLTSDGTYLKLDKNGNDQAFKLLQQTKQKDHLRVTVTGTREGDTIKVQSITI